MSQLPMELDIEKLVAAALGVVTPEQGKAAAINAAAAAAAAAGGGNGYGKGGVQDGQMAGDLPPPTGNGRRASVVMPGGPVSGAAAALPAWMATGTACGKVHES